MPDVSFSFVMMCVLISATTVGTLFAIWGMINDPTTRPRGGRRP